MRKKHSLLLILGIFLLTGCTMPLQNDSYPAWKTKGLIEGQTIIDNDVIGGWMGVDINDEVKTSTIIFQVEDYQEKIIDNNISINLKLRITNPLEEDIKISTNDFVLMWNLENKDASYSYPINEARRINLFQNEEKELELTYNIDKTNKKPYALFYGETYNDDLEGNSYYVYIK